MAAKDKFHKDIKAALINDGWTVTHDPYEIKDKALISKNLEIDLAAEKILAAEKDKQKIAVEVKSLVSDSIIYEFHSILGQYLNYQVALDTVEPDRILYIAIPEQGYKRLLKEGITKLSIERFAIKIIIFDIDNQSIIQWKN
jgi:XisH protein